MTTALSGSAFALGILLAGTTAAATGDPPDNIVVTATRSAMSVDRATVPVTVITRQEIEQSMAADIAELLRFEAGVDIGRNGGPGQATSVFMRGSESNHVLVLIDGVRINPGTLGGAAVQHIAPEMIERIEIVKGARSSLFGTDAIGGVINIITRRSDRAWLEAGAGAGSFDTRSARLAAGRREDDHDFGVALNWQRSNGYAISSAADVERGYENLSLNGHLGRQLGEHYVSFRHWQATGTSEYLDFFLTPLDQDFTNQSSAVEIASSPGKGLDSKLVLSHIRDDIRQNQSDDLVRSRRNALDWQVSLQRGRQQWIGGLYLVGEDAATASFGTGFDEDTRLQAVFLEHQWSGDRHRSFTAVRLTDHDSFGRHATWNAEYGYAISDDWSLHGGAGHAFRAPDATDRFGFGGRPDLRPETADEYQLGTRFRPAPRHALALELYRRDIEDLIEFDLATFELRNIGEARIRGAELSWEYRGDAFTLKGSLLRQSAEDAGSERRLVRRAEKSATLKVLRNIGAHRIGLALLASGDRADIGDSRLPGYALLNLTGEIALADDWRINARIENMLDRAYETAAGFRMQERSVFVDLTYDWN